MTLPPRRLQREQGVITGQQLQVARRHGQLGRIEQNVDQPERLHIQIVVRTRTADHKCVTGGKFVLVLAGNVLTFSSRDDHDFGEFVGMQAKGFLWITAFHRNGEAVFVKPIFLEQRADHAGTIVLVPGTIVKDKGAELCILFPSTEPNCPFLRDKTVTNPTDRVEQAYQIARDTYAELGVDVEFAIEQMKRAPISLHCWQGDDVGGFENANQEIGGGLAVTGNYPGKARTPDELRSDLEMAYSLIPGKHRLNLHACYGEFQGAPVDRDQVGPEHFQGWIDWAKAQGIGLDFNPTFFAHEKADDGFTLSHPDAAIRQFWIDHGIACRKIGAAMGAAQGSPCVTNVWIPDGFKDTPASRKAPRERLAESLDAVFAEPIDPSVNLDAVECKLFGLGSESYVVGSHEFYLGYAITRNKVLCLDAGHFHPTEVISDKISSVMMYVPELLLHVSRGVRWDSDHVVTLTDELQAIATELVRGDYLDRVHIGLDFFDASINRVAAWAIGTRNMLKALLLALLEPTQRLQTLELEGDFTRRLALMEELKTLPFGAVWDYYCLKSDVPVGSSWLDKIAEYETNVLSARTNESATV